MLRARLRICWLAAAVMLLTAAVPLMPTPALAAALISFSFFWCLAISTNLYAMPIDFFGARHAAFGGVDPDGVLWVDADGTVAADRRDGGSLRIPGGVRFPVGDAAGGHRDPADDDAMTRARAATAEDLAAIAEIQDALAGGIAVGAGELSQLRLLGGGRGRRYVGFLVARQTAPGEREILNLAVDPSQRRRGVARALLQAELGRGKNQWFLEVRESNLGAIRLYQSAGFRVAGRRESYYSNPPNRVLS